MTGNAEKLFHPLRDQAGASSSGSAGGAENSMDQFLNAFSSAARETLLKADEEARRLGHVVVATEHLLLGAIFTAPDLFEEMNYDAGKIVTAVEFIAGRENRAPTSGPIGLSPRAVRVLRLASDEYAARTGNTTPNEEVDQYDLLIAILREGEGLGAGVLESLGASLDKVRSATQRIRERKRTPKKA